MTPREGDTCGDPRAVLLCMGRLPCPFHSCPMKRMVDAREGLSKEAKAGSRFVMESQRENCILPKKRCPGALYPNHWGYCMAFGYNGPPGLRLAPAMAP